MLLTLFFTLPHVQEQTNSSRFQLLNSVISEINAGNFMQMRKGVSINAGLYEDPGLGAFAVIYIWTVKTFFNSDYIADWHIVYGIQFAIYACVLTLCCLVSDAPLFLAFAICSVGASFLLDQATWWYNCYWGPSLAVIVTCLTVAAMAFEHWLRKGVLFFFAAACGFMAGALGLLRQDASLIAQGGMALFILVYSPILLVRAARKKPLPRQGKKCFLVALLFLAMTMLPPFAYHGMLNVHQALTGIRHDIGAGVHGVWHNLYIGLGYYPNKYDIKWDDSVGAAHAEKEDPTGTFGSKNYMPTMRRLYFKILTNDPEFFFTTTAKKSLEMVQQLGGIEFVVAFIASTAFLIALSLRKIFFPNATVILFPAWIICVACAPPVMAIPTVPYISGAQTAMLCGWLFIAMYFLELLRQIERESLTPPRPYSLRYWCVLLAKGLHFSSIEAAFRYMGRHWRPMLILLLSLACLGFIARRHHDQSRPQTASDNVAHLAKILQIAQIKTHAPLPDITQNSCSECPCREIGNLQEIAEKNPCRVNWRNALIGMWRAASGQEPFNSKGRLLLEDRVLQDPWGAPYCLDENARTIRSAGPDGLLHTKDDIAVTIPPEPTR